MPKLNGHCRQQRDPQSAVRREMFVEDTAASLWNFWGGAGIACCCSESLNPCDGRMTCGDKFLIQLYALAAKES